MISEHIKLVSGSSFLFNVRVLGGSKRRQIHIKTFVKSWAFREEFLLERFLLKSFLWHSAFVHWVSDRVIETVCPHFSTWSCWTHFVQSCKLLSNMSFTENNSSRRWSSLLVWSKHTENLQNIRNLADHAFWFDLDLRLNLNSLGAQLFIRLAECCLERAWSGPGKLVDTLACLSFFGWWYNQKENTAHRFASQQELERAD